MFTGGDLVAEYSGKPHSKSVKLGALSARQPFCKYSTVPTSCTHHSNINMNIALNVDGAVLQAYDDVSSGAASYAIFRYDGTRSWWARSGRSSTGGAS